MEAMLYPTFELHPEKGILPRVHLPFNYKELVRKFYVQNRKQDIEGYAKGLEKTFKGNCFDIRLNWDEKLGLTNISLGGHPGFDLNDSGTPSFQEHNLGMFNSLFAGAIAQKYISELLKSK